jgi:hypothetical protein
MSTNDILTLVLSALAVCVSSYSVYRQVHNVENVTATIAEQDSMAVAFPEGGLAEAFVIDLAVVNEGTVPVALFNPEIWIDLSPTGRRVLEAGTDIAQQGVRVTDADTGAKVKATVIRPGEIVVKHLAFDLNLSKTFVPDWESRFRPPGVDERTIWQLSLRLRSLTPKGTLKTSSLTFLGFDYFGGRVTRTELWSASARLR